MLDVFVNFVHLLATAIWIGGALFIHFILTPSLKAISPSEAGKVMGALSKRFSIAAWLSIVSLLVTGILKTPEGLYLDSSSEVGLYLMVKHLCIGVVIINGLLIAFAVVPRLRAAAPSGGEAPSAAFHRAQRQLSLLSSTNTFLGMVILYCAASLGM